MIELKFKYESKDYRDFARACLGIRRIFIAHFKPYLLWIGIFSLIIAGMISDVLINNTIFYDISSQYVEPSNFFKFLTFAITFFIILIFLTACGILGQYFLGGRKIENLRKGVNPDTRIVMDSEVLDIYSGKSVHGIYNWDSVKDIYNTEKLLIIFPSDFLGIIIPKRIFKTNKEVENCWNFILTCYKQSKTKKSK